MGAACPSRLRGQMRAWSLRPSSRWCCRWHCSTADSYSCGPECGSSARRTPRRAGVQFLRRVLVVLRRLRQIRRSRLAHRGRGVRDRAFPAGLDNLHRLYGGSVAAGLRRSGRGVIALLATFILLTLGAYSGVAAITNIGGCVAIATAALAWYASFAGVTNSTFKKTVPPVFPAAAG